MTAERALNCGKAWFERRRREPAILGVISNARVDDITNHMGHGRLIIERREERMLLPITA